MLATSPDMSIQYSANSIESTSNKPSVLVRYIEMGRIEDAHFTRSCPKDLIKPHKYPDAIPGQFDTNMPILVLNMPNPTAR